MSGVCSVGCMGGGGGIEGFTNSPANVPQQASCTLKGQSCQYNAQGELVCGGQQGQLVGPTLIPPMRTSCNPYDLMKR